ncbi:WD40 [Musa troglodytarum]|uniref:WD40 n=1 Tax=Musa troglodytarum TaxID=320322 RepID=A0A9E7KYB8_9LILI|nr:WD40 [Musa troglodytarum]
MASSSAVSPSASLVLCASFNQDNSWFSVGTKDGFKLFDARTGRLCFERAVGAFSIVEMLFSTNLLAIVGAGEQGSVHFLLDRKVAIWLFQQVQLRDLHVRIYSIDNISSAPGVSGFRASIFIITHNGYFREYSLNVTKSNECSWSLEREVNVLDTISNDPN